MFIRGALLSSLLLSLNSFGASSEIPLKREFPLNDKINPCENLYEYACSKTIESFQLRPDRRRHSFAFSDSAERILSFKKNYIKELTMQERSTPIAGQIKNFYISCMNKEARAKEEVSEVQKLIADQKKIRTKKEWLKIQAQRIHSGKSSFVNYSVSDNFDDAKKSDLILGIGYSILPEKSYAKNDELIKAFFVLVTDYFRTIGIDHPEIKAQTVLKYEIDQQENRFYPVEARIAYSQRRFISKDDLIKKYHAVSH
jgi:putative endopeptidase